MNQFKNIFIAILILLSFKSYAQLDTAKLPPLIMGMPRFVHAVPVQSIANIMARYEDSLIYYVDSITVAMDEDTRMEGNVLLIKTMKNMFKQKNSFGYPFNKFKQRINIIQAQDKSFRIFNWDLLRQNGTMRYYAVVQFANGNVFPLIDVSDQVVRQQEDTILTENKWFGVSLYNIIERRTATANYYFLLGVNEGNMQSTKKVVECMTIKNDKVIFGAPVFESIVKAKGKPCNRFVAEYDKRSRIGLNWDNEKQMIIFDHLESSIGDNAKRYSFVPDGTYDGLRWNDRGWKLISNAIQILQLQDGQAPEGTPVQGKEIKH
jgi:hypothetical protein